MTNVTNFNKGIISSSVGSFWWGVIGTYYFQYIAFVGTFEVVVHRCIWTTLMLLITTTFFNKWHLFKKNIFDKKTLQKSLKGVTVSDVLIMRNWLGYAKKIGDLSYKNIINDMTMHPLIEKELSNQLLKRSKEFTSTLINE